MRGNIVKLITFYGEKDSLSVNGILIHRESTCVITLHIQAGVMVYKY